MFISFKALCPKGLGGFVRKEKALCLGVAMLRNYSLAVGIRQP